MGSNLADGRPQAERTWERTPAIRTAVQVQLNFSSMQHGCGNKLTILLSNPSEYLASIRRIEGIEYTNYMMVYSIGAGARHHVRSKIKDVQTSS